LRSRTIRIRFKSGRGPDENLGPGPLFFFLFSFIYNVTAIACGIDHVLALKTDGTVWAWGNNRWGELGDGTYDSGFIPVKSMIGPRAAGEPVSLP
jgi:alpha-tubulin suppressor-like RCC1 family protein